MTGMKLSRSRPYRKNDNRNVEQKNHTLVRAYLGHARLDTPEEVRVVNEIYELMWGYYTLFQPVMHLIEQRIEGGKLVRVHDEPRTPYERLKETGVLGPEAREELDGAYARTNPRGLRRQIRARLSGLWEIRAQVAA